MLHSDPIIRRMHACVLAGVPVVLWGSPGTGKTARVMAYGQARALHVERWLASRCEPIDIKPRIYHEGRIVVGLPPELERLRSAGGILFADELNRATREVEGALLDVFDNPPANTAIIAACNPPSRGQAARSLESAAANRFCHIDVVSDAAAWANACIGGWSMRAGDLGPANPDALARETSDASTLVSAFIRARGESMLEALPANPVDAGKAWPSPRTWTYAQKLYAMAVALGLPTEDEIALLSGCVGAGPATEFLAFVESADLPDPEEILADPVSFVPDPGRIDRTVVTLTAVVGAVERTFTDVRWCAAWSILGTCAKEADIAPAIIAGHLLVDAFGRFARRDAAGAKGLTPAHKLMPPRVAHVLVPRGAA